MAYAAVISLQRTLHECIFNSGRVSIASNSSPEIAESLSDEIISLRNVLEELDGIISNSSRERLNAMDGAIREAVCELEDALESHLSDQFLSQSKEEENRSPLVSSVNVEELKQDIDSFVATVNKLKAEYVDELQNPSPDDDQVRSKTDFHGNESDIFVGLSHQFSEIRDRLTENLSPFVNGFVSLVGMAGIGKTTLAVKLFQDPTIVSRFEKRAFVAVGPDYQLEDVLLDVLKQLKHDSEDRQELIMEGEANLEDLRRMIFESLVDRRYLIVLDDVWRSELWYRMTNLFPNNGSQLLLTTRLQQVAEIVSPLTTYRIGFLDKKESWDLLRQKVFLREELCSYQLEKAGKKIADNCEGLPLTIIKVAEILSKVEKTTEYWNIIAANKQHSVFVDAYEKMYKVLYPSYDYLPQHLKVCFLYMGIFSQSFEIQQSKIVNLWTAEGFLQSTYSSLDEILENLVSSSLVIVHQKSLVMKTFGLNSAIWHLCNKVAVKTKFFHGLSSLADGVAEEGLKSQRRLSIRNTVLFGIKDVLSKSSKNNAKTIVFHNQELID